MKKIDKTRKEKIGWMILAEKSLNKIWGDKKDDEVWINIYYRTKKL